MDFSRPSRSSRPAQRATTAQPQRRASEPMDVAETETTKSQATYRPTPAKHQPARKSFFKKPFVRALALLVVVLAIVGWLWWSDTKNSETAINPSRYQSVFLVNGQVYFGKLEPFTNKAMKMTDVFYLQTKGGAADDSANPQQSATAQNNVELIKLGNEIHGPEDEMVILLDQMMYYENLKPGSKLVESIEQYKKSQD